MSTWSYVQGIVEIHSIGKTQPELEYVLKTVLEHLPKVTGSEQDMQVYINQCYGHSVSCSHDEFLCRSNLGTGYGGWFETQTQYLLTLKGRLRDRSFEETLKAITKWLTRLSKRIRVQDVLVCVSGNNKEYIISNSEHYDSLFDPDDLWVDYLLWWRKRGDEENE